MNDVVQRLVGFREDVGDTFVCRRQRGGLFQGTEVRYGLHTRIEIRRAGWTARQYCLDSVDAVAFVLLPGAEAAQHKVDHVINHINIGQLLTVQTHRFFGQRLQIEIQVLLDNDA